MNENKREDYTLEEIVNSGKAELFETFNRNYVEWLNEKVEKWPEVAENYAKNVPPSLLIELARKDIPEISESGNYNRLKGMLDQACAAAKHLVYRYDVGIGIAKKGLWLAYIFNLFGLKTVNYLMIRTGDGRVAVALDRATEKDFAGKRVLLLDNDCVTGKSIKAAAEHLKAAGAKPVDALFMYSNTELKPEYYEEVKGKFKHNPKLLGERDGMIVLDATCEAAPHVRRIMSLENDYLPRPELLQILGKKLGVDYEPH